MIIPQISGTIREAKYIYNILADKINNLTAERLIILVPKG